MSHVLIQPSPTTEHRSNGRRDAWRAIAVCAFLVVAVAIVFGRTLSQGFSNLDDRYFVGSEPHVSGGFTWSGIAWAFTNGPLGDWYPLSMLSHMLDCQLYGLHPAGHHLTNVLLHAATAVALFLVLWRMTGELWPSALVAALFALHPLRVESVAWVAERRDVLSGLLFMLTLGAYGEYVRHPRSLGRYLAVVGFFALGLMAKPMLVTLPPLLLLLDYWPLGRFRQADPDRRAPNSQPAPFPWRVVLEKLPLMALVVPVAGVTMHAQDSTWHPPLTLSEQLANAAVSYVAYLGQFFVPVGLSIFYPFPEGGRPVWEVAAAVALLLAITVAVVVGRRTYPYFFVGWFWYVGTMVPVLGLTHLAAHARADRYTYLPQIGIDIALVWGVARLGASWPARRWVFGVGSAAMLAALMACSWRQAGFWRDDETLWEHALACDPKNARAHEMLGVTLMEQDENRAAAHYRQALELSPHERNIYTRIRAQADCALGDLAARQGDVGEAIARYEQALEFDSGFAPAHMNLGVLLDKRGDFDGATKHFERAIELVPDNAVLAYCDLAFALAERGKTDEAIASFRKAVEADSEAGNAHLNLAILLAERGDVDEASVHLRRAMEIDPDVASAYHQMARLLRRQGQASEAAKYDERGIQASRRYAKAQNLRGTELAQQDRIDEAIAQFEIAISIDPNFAQAHNNLADALASQGKTAEAIGHYRRALEIDPNFAPAKRSLAQLSRQ